MTRRAPLREISIGTFYDVAKQRAEYRFEKSLISRYYYAPNNVDEDSDFPESRQFLSKLPANCCNKFAFPSQMIDKDPESSVKV